MDPKNTKKNKKIKKKKIELLLESIEGRKLLCNTDLQLRFPCRKSLNK